MLWSLFIAKFSIRSLTLMMASLLLVVGLEQLANRWGYGRWSFPEYNYFNECILKGRVLYGEASGWEHLFKAITFKGGPQGIAILLCSLVAWIRFPKHLLTWATLSFFAVHQYMAHKQLNHQFPIASLALILIPLGLHGIVVPRSILRRFAGAFLIGINFILLCFFTLTPADTKVRFFSRVAEKPRPMTLYTIGDDPYRVVENLRMNFYKPKNVYVKQMGSPQDLKSLLMGSDTPVWVAVRALSFPAEWQVGNCVFDYANFPVFLRNHNYNHWIERSGVWSLYSCSRNQ